MMKSDTTKSTQPPSVQPNIYDRYDGAIGRRYRKLETGSVNGMGYEQCGANALELSTKYQLGGSKQTTLTPAIFCHLRKGHLYQAWEKHWKEKDNIPHDTILTKDYYDDQLAAILFLFGLRCGKKLSLGVVSEADGLAYSKDLPSCPVWEQEYSEDFANFETNFANFETGTIWIHNETVQNFMHWSGLDLESTHQPEVSDISTL